jgi:NTP pyrophosphatase (non-canonical NTP hydrolase)
MSLTEKQQAVAAWAIRCFGLQQVSDPEIRSLRLAEEAIEFAQAVGTDQAKLHALIDYVYSRPSGEPSQEIGGVGVTWLAAAQSISTDAECALDDEMSRIFSKPEDHFAARNQVKIEAGFK